MKQAKTDRSAIFWPAVYAFLKKTTAEVEAEIKSFLEKNPKWLAHVDCFSCSNRICISFGINPASFPKRKVIGIDSVGGKPFCKPTAEETDEVALLIAKLFPRGKNLSAHFMDSKRYDFLEYEIRIARYKPFIKKSS